MHLRTFTTLAAVTTTVSALAAPPHAHQAVAAIGPEVTQPPSLQTRQDQVHGAFRAEPRPRVVNGIKKRDSDEGDNDDSFPVSFSTSLKPLYTSCALAYESLITSAPQPTGKVEDWLAEALDDDQIWTSATSEVDPYGNVCGTFKSPLTPPASLASSYSAFTSATASYLSAHQSEVTSLASACSPVYYDVVFTMLMPYSNYEQCTSRYYPYMSVYASLACAANTRDCSLTSQYAPKTTGAGAGAGHAADATTTAAGSGATGASGSGAAGASSTTTASGNAGAPKQTFAAAAALAGFVAAVAAL
ncbi:hypothetical protein QBC45DRAFT_418854 [Copromyces sp. CBS 386.78]|nr:hypothetical protein QBC45DRAFT_418854 [Copromyces sp. CBS 386.78]